MLGTEVTNSSSSSSLALDIWCGMYFSVFIINFFAYFDEINQPSSVVSKVFISIFLSLVKAGLIGLGSYF